MLRKLFDAVPDIVTLTRFSDGSCMEVNEEVLKRTGLTREEALATSVIKMAAWVQPEERAAYVERLQREGRVRDLEVDFRLRGTVVPYLMSAVVIEIENELYALNVARDATGIKENERALREAQERLSAPAHAALDRDRRCGWKAIMQSRRATAALCSSHSLPTAHTRNS